MAATSNYSVLKMTLLAFNWEEPAPDATWPGRRWAEFAGI